MSKLPHCETFHLFHGTTSESAMSISNDNCIYPSDDGWCGKGVYFYDNKAKAYWSADRTCRKQEKESGNKFKSAIICADLIDINVKWIFDLRTSSGLAELKNIFDEFIEDSGENNTIEIADKSDDSSNSENEAEKKKRKLRAMLISYFADKFGKKLVIGYFKQENKENQKDAYQIADEWDLAFGIEAIYCVKDISIIQNISMGGKRDGQDV